MRENNKPWSLLKVTASEKDEGTLFYNLQNHGLNNISRHPTARVDVFCLECCPGAH